MIRKINQKLPQNPPLEDSRSLGALAGNPTVGRGPGPVAPARPLARVTGLGLLLINQANQLTDQELRTRNQLSMRKSQAARPRSLARIAKSRRRKTSAPATHTKK